MPTWRGRLGGSPSRAQSPEGRRGPARSRLPERLQDELAGHLERVEDPGSPQRDRFEVGCFPGVQLALQSSTGTTRGRSRLLYCMTNGILSRFKSCSVRLSSIFM